jgi:hypothetical protein
MPKGLEKEHKSRGIGRILYSAASPGHFMRNALAHAGKSGRRVIVSLRRRSARDLWVMRYADQVITEAMGSKVTRQGH